MSDRSLPDLTPETHVKLSTAKFLGILWAVICFVTGVVAIAVWSYAKAISRLDEHVSDKDVHLDKDYMRDHGHPIGRWDLEVERNETKQRLDDMNKEMKEMHDVQIQMSQRRR